MKLKKQLEKDKKALLTELEVVDRTSEIHHEVFERSTRLGTSIRRELAAIQTILDQLSPSPYFPMQGKRNRSPKETP